MCVLVCNIQVLSVDTLVQEAIQAFLNNETKTEHNLISQEAESSAKQNKVSILVNLGFGSHREKRVVCIRKKVYCFNFLLNFRLRSFFLTDFKVHLQLLFSCIVYFFFSNLFIFLTDKRFRGTSQHHQWNF